MVGKPRNPVVRAALAAPKRNAGRHADKRRPELDQLKLDLDGRGFVPCSSCTGGRFPTTGPEGACTDCLNTGLQPE